MRRYLILIEPTGTGFSAYSPDLPGCAATGATHDDVQRSMRDAVELHLEGLVRWVNRYRRPVHPPPTWKSLPDVRRGSLIWLVGSRTMDSWFEVARRDDLRDRQHRLRPLRGTDAQVAPRDEGDRVPRRHAAHHRAVRAAVVLPRDRHPAALFVVVHGWWLPRQGINGWTAEPKERYYKFRGWTLPPDGG